MRKFIEYYCKRCTICKSIKKLTSKPIGSLFPDPKSTRPWDTISLDFYTGLPPVDDFECITTLVDTFTKQAHFIPCGIHINAPQLARLFLDNIYRHHGLYRTIISDRDHKFTFTFWQTLFKSMRTKLDISSPFHPQTDGQTGCTLRTIEHILRAFMHQKHDD
jgi:hypothetical protein